MSGESLTALLRRTKQTLCVPAAEYVPAMGDAMLLLDRAIQMSYQTDPCWLSSSAAERAVVEEKAALFDYLVEYCSYSYGGDSYSEPSPPEFGIQWEWRATTTARPSMLDQLRRDAFAKFDLYVNEMDPDDEPTEFGRLIISHRDALSSVRGEGGDKQATRASGPTAPTDRL